ncbi:MAG: PrsW family intramembrane metalloprotease [Acidobacteria bacterium]|nr:PrsW family intramembrane metalloprotease [Acidobacteriota bacterium]
MKLTLNIQTGSLAGRNFELTEGFLTIGRGERCNIRFDPLTERIASKEHCFIEAKPDGFYLTDNRSTNGTILNGERIQTARLSSGDRIQFGKNGVVAGIAIGDAVSTNQPTSVMQDFQAPVSNIPGPSQDFQPSAITQIAQPVQPVVNQSFAPVSTGADFYTPQPTRPFQNPSMNLRNSLQSLGMGSLPPNYLTVAEEPQGKRYWLIALAIFVIIFLSLVVFLLISSSLSRSADGSFTLTLEGVLTAVMASFVAFIPAMFYLVPLVWLDRYDPEPAWLLALAFAWGALVAVFVSFIINTTVGQTVFSVTRDADAANAISGIISAPIFEEGSKGLGVILLLVFFRKYFDDILDGIIFAGVVALGFATVENVLYYGRGILQGTQMLFVLLIMRGVLSPFAHVTFTSMTGIGCGISRESHNKAVRIFMPLLGYICAVALHAFWNGVAFLGGCGGFIISYFVLELPFFLIGIGFTIYVMRRQNKIIRDMLAIDVARGLIPTEHLQKATSAISSTGWLISGLFSGNFKARNAYLRAIGKLGLSYWHIQRATAAQGQTASFQQNPILRAEVLKWRPQVD